MDELVGGISLTYVTTLPSLVVIGLVEWRFSFCQISRDHVIDELWKSMSI